MYSDCGSAHLETILCHGSLQLLGYAVFSLEADPMTLYYKVSSKSQGVWDKNPEKKWEVFGSASTLGQDVKLEANLPWRQDVFYKTGLETTRTSPKPITDEPYQVLTSCIEKQTGLEKHTGPHDQT